MNYLGTELQEKIPLVVSRFPPPSAERVERITRDNHAGRILCSWKTYFDSFSFHAGINTSYAFHNSENTFFCDHVRGKWGTPPPRSVPSREMIALDMWKLEVAVQGCLNAFRSYLTTGYEKIPLAAMEQRPGGNYLYTYEKASEYVNAHPSLSLRVENYEPVNVMVFIHGYSIERLY